MRAAGAERRRVRRGCLRPAGMSGDSGSPRARLTRRQVGQHGGDARRRHEHRGAGARAVQKGPRIRVGGLAGARGQRQALVYIFPGAALTCREEGRVSRSRPLCPAGAVAQAALLAPQPGGSWGGSWNLQGQTAGGGGGSERLMGHPGCSGNVELTSSTAGASEVPGWARWALRRRNPAGPQDAGSGRWEKAPGWGGARGQAQLGILQSDSGV